MYLLFRWRLDTTRNWSTLGKVTIMRVNDDGNRNRMSKQTRTKGNHHRPQWNNDCHQKFILDLTPKFDEFVVWTM